MKNVNIYTCYCGRTNNLYCSLTPTCKGWGCRFLSTPINDIPTTEKEKAKLFSAVYREAKQKGVLECPHYRSLFIDEVLENISKMQQITDKDNSDFAV
ncbi:hypothetical protein [Bacteroides ovatus]|uniref:hypothetical protein n=1 Tax=Bacteroides ovatus TaxID=28116 RepID=UPI0020A7874A|nr:hypothetical protein [Bacteroides ovatus]CAG9926755.1 hypothetical protein BOVAC16_4445 [Bacteroides ovatus]